MELQHTLRSFLSSYETYPFVRDIKLRVLYGDKAHIKLVQQCLARFLVDPDESPILRLLTLKFNKELAETFNEEYIHLMQKIVLPKLEEFAIFEKDKKDSDRGKLFFLGNAKAHEGNKELQAIGDQFLRVTLECIRIWGRWFPLDKQHHRLSLYRVSYERLYNLGVQFPEIQYFDMNQVFNNLPKTFPPLSMMFQLKNVLTEHGRSTTKEVCRYLESHLPEEHHQTQYASYAELFQFVVKKHIISKKRQMKIANIFMEQEQKYNEVKKMEEYEEWSQLQRLQIENQQLSYLNNMHQYQMQEFQKQIIEVQNQNLLLSQQLMDKQRLVEKLQLDLDELNKKFQKLYDEVKNHHQIKNALALAQLERSLAQYRIELGMTYTETQLIQIKSQNEYLCKQLEESDSMYEKMKHDKEVIMTENKLLSARVSQLQQKIAKGTKIEKDTPSQVSGSEGFQLFKQKSSLVQQEQTIIQQKQQINQLKEHLLKLNDKKYSVTSQTQGVSTKSNSRRNINEIVACNIQTKPFENGKRQSKIIMPPILEYDPTVFAVNPTVFNTRFRQACFTQRAILFTDENIQISTNTFLKKNILLVTLTVENRSKNNFTDFSIDFPEVEQLNTSLIEEVRNQINSGEQQQIKIQILIRDVPYFIQEAVIKCRDKVINLAIPCSINKFLVFKSCEEIPTSYFYQSKPFLTGFQNAIPNLLPDFEIVSQSETEISVLTQAEYNQDKFEILIQCRKSMMQIKMNGTYNDKLVQTIISTYQGLFLKR